MNWPTLNSERFIYTPVQEADRSLYVALLNNEVVMRFLQRLPSEERISNGFSYLLRQMQTPHSPFVFYTISDSQNKHQYGLVSIVFADDRSEANLGVVLGLDSHRRRVASEAFTFFAEHILEANWADDVVAYIHPKNEAAIGCASQLSLERRGTRELLGETLSFWEFKGRKQ